MTKWSDARIKTHIKTCIGARNAKLKCRLTGCPLNLYTYIYTYVCILINVTLDGRKTCSRDEWKTEWLPYCTKHVLGDIESFLK